MNTTTLNKANDLSNKIHNLELILNDFYVNNANSFCACSTLTGTGKYYGYPINDSGLCVEIKKLINDRIDKYKKEFEEL